MFPKIIHKGCFRQPSFGGGSLVADITTVRGFVGQSGDLEEPHGSLSDYGMFFEHLDLLVKMVAQALLKEDIL